MFSKVTSVDCEKKISILIVCFFFPKTVSGRRNYIYGSQKHYCVLLKGEKIYVIKEVAVGLVA